MSNPDFNQYTQFNNRALAGSLIQIKIPEDQSQGLFAGGTNRSGVFSYTNSLQPYVSGTHRITYAVTSHTDFAQLQDAVSILEDSLTIVDNAINCLSDDAQVTVIDGDGNRVQLSGAYLKHVRASQDFTTTDGVGYGPLAAGKNDATVQSSDLASADQRHNSTFDLSGILHYDSTGNPQGYAAIAGGMDFIVLHELGHSTYLGVKSTTSHFDQYYYSHGSSSSGYVANGGNAASSLWLDNEKFANHFSQDLAQQIGIDEHNNLATHPNAVGG